MRAEIDGIGNAVEIVVGLGTSILVLEAIPVLGRVRTAICQIGDLITVVVELLTAVVVLEAVFVLDVPRTLSPHGDKVQRIALRERAIRESGA